MYEFIEGKISYKTTDYFVIEANNIGYRVHCAPPMLAGIPKPGETTRVFTSLIVRDDSHTLYGFKDREELFMFEMLLSVTGIGPKVASLIVANIEPSKFAVAVLTSDVSLISQIKGIGKKGAQRVVLELKDKLKGISFDNDEKEMLNIQNAGKNLENKYREACSALAVLGYSPSQAASAVSKVYDENVEVEKIIKLALRELM